MADALTLPWLWWFDAGGVAMSGLWPLSGRQKGAIAGLIVLAFAVGVGAVLISTREKPGQSDSSSAPPRSVSSATASISPGVPTTSTPIATDSIAPSAAPPGGVLRQSVAVLRDQDYLDVESGLIGEANRDSDLWYVGGYRELWTSGGGQLRITRVTGAPDMNACVDELASRDYDFVEISEMRVGDWACANTAEGNVVAAQVTGLPTGTTELTISYTVWQK